MEQKEPFFSIIIPTYNNTEQLAICLQSVVDLDYPRDRFEVIVVDDGSDVPPEDVVHSFGKQLDITLLTQPNAGPAAARNTGVAQAKGECLAFTDDDCFPSVSWLSSLASCFLDAPDCAIGGRTINALSNNLFSTASQTIIDFVYAYYNDDPRHARFLASNNLALPAKAFKVTGGFDPMLRTSEDRELCERWLHQGYRMIFAPEAVIYHSHALTFRTFWRQHLNYGRGAFRFRRKLAQRDKTSIRLESKSFYLDLFRYPFSHHRKWSALKLSLLLLISQVASAVGFMNEWINQTRRR